ncbi:MAG: NUDIX domain-containing protein [bacterium]
MRSGAIIINENKILLIHRYSNGKEYFVLPGGGAESGELPHETAVREAKEETGLDVVLNKNYFEFVDPRDNCIHLYFIVDKFSGEMKLGGEEAVENSDENRYILEWHEISKIEGLEFYPVDIKHRIIQTL